MCFDGSAEEEYEVNSRDELERCPLGIHLRSMIDFRGFQYEALLGYGVLYARFVFDERFPVVVVNKQEDVETMSEWFGERELHPNMTEEQVKQVAQDLAEMMQDM